jgi:hypothetical protein
VQRRRAPHHDGIVEHDVAADEHGHWLMQISSTRPRFSAC